MKVERGTDILIVDDDASIRRFFGRALARGGLRSREAVNGQDALDQINLVVPSVVLLDSNMPDLDGIQVLARLRADLRTRTLPVIMVSGLGDTTNRVEGLDAGANDYLIKPVQADELVARVRAQLRGMDAWHEILTQSWDERSRTVTRIAKIATDPAVSDPGEALCVALTEIPDVDGVAVLGFNGDDVTVLADHGFTEWAGLTSLSRGLALSIRRQSAEGPWTEGSGMRGKARKRGMPAAFAPMVRGGAVLGVLVLMSDPRAHPLMPAGSLLSVAIDIAPSVAEVVAVRLTGQIDPVERRAQLEALIDRNGFKIMFEPIVRLDDRHPVGYEALSRFDDGRRPDLWFVDAVNLGLSDRLQLATLREAARCARELPDGTYASFNATATLLQQRDVLDEMVASAGRPVTFELTEREVVDDYEGIRRAIAGVPGAVLAVDDAGAGYASLNHILALRPGAIKLDKTWVRDVSTDRARQALISGLVHFAAALNAELVAEGVETEAEAATLSKLGVPLAQGYLFGRAAPAAAWRIEVPQPV